MEKYEEKQKMKKIMKKSANGVSIIGGADGPTSIFIAGKSKKFNLKHEIKKYLYKQRRAQVEKTIVANPHTLLEVVKFMREKYGAIQVSEQSQSYIEERDCLKESLIIQHKPELLGELAQIAKPVNRDEDSLREFWKKLEERSQKAREVSDDDFLMDFHIYEISVPDVGKMRVMIDAKWDVFGCSYSGSKKGMEKLKSIAKELYVYYGVTKRDIQERTQRYSALVTELAS